MKKSFFGTIVFLVWFMLAFSLVGCGDNGDNSTLNDNNGGVNPQHYPPDDYFDGWPPNSVLSNAGISGMLPPVGTSDYYYGYDIATKIEIIFTATDNTQFVVYDWFTNNGWSVTNEVDNFIKFSKGTLELAEYRFHDDFYGFINMGSICATTTGW